MNIKIKFMLAGTAFCVALSVAAVWVDSYFLQSIFFDQYKEKARILLYSMRAVRAHTGTVIRPRATELIGEGFVTELQSTSYAANGVFAKIPEENRYGLNFKTASIKPRNPNNRANEAEMELIKLLDELHIKGKEPVWQGFRQLNGVESYVIAVGEVNKPACMQCHGRPEEAPEGMRKLYPVAQDDGYGHLPDRVESAEIVSIPLAAVEASVDRLRIYSAIISIFFLTIALVGINYFLNAIFRPVRRVTDVAQQIADGDLQGASESLDSYSEGSSRPSEQVEQRKKEPDETGKLLNSFNVMAHNLNSLVGQVQNSGIQVTTSATEIAASARELEATAAQQAISLNEVSTTSNEIFATSKELAGTVQQVAGMVSGTAKLVGQGQNGLADMEQIMRRLVTATTTFSARLSTINEKANNIGSIITTIAKVADQTNLLSLNAAIEAEKAGEYGLGFSVVAREIRRLADQTGVAAQDIEHMVTAMQSAVSAGVMEMDKFSEEVRRGVEEVTGVSGMLGQIIAQVQYLEPQFEAVKVGMQAQSAGAQQISEAINQLSEAAQQTRASLQEFKDATVQLNEVVQDLRSEVARFRVGGA